MGICLSCGTETATPPICNACFNTTHRKGCRCQVCFDTLQSSIAALEAELAAEREAVRVWREKHKVLVEEVDAWREWNDREPHNPDAGIMRIEDARAATDAAKAREA